MSTARRGVHGRATQGGDDKGTEGVNRTSAACKEAGPEECCQEADEGLHGRLEFGEACLDPDLVPDPERVFNTSRVPSLDLDLDMFRDPGLLLPLLMSSRDFGFTTPQRIRERLNRNDTEPPGASTPFILTPCGYKSQQSFKEYILN